MKKYEKCKNALANIACGPAEDGKAGAELSMKSRKPLLFVPVFFPLWSMRLASTILVKNANRLQNKKIFLPSACGKRFSAIMKSPVGTASSEPPSRHKEREIFELQVREYADLSCWNRTHFETGTRKNTLSYAKKRKPILPQFLTTKKFMQYRRFRMLFVVVYYQRSIF